MSARSTRVGPACLWMTVSPLSPEQYTYNNPWQMTRHCPSFPSFTLAGCTRSYASSTGSIPWNAARPLGELRGGSCGEAFGTAAL